jgi:hypothetical protein
MASSSNNPLNNFEENTEDIGRRLSDAFFGPSNPYPQNPIPPTYPQNPIPPTYPQNPIPPTYQQIPNYQPNPNYQQNPTNLNFPSPYFQQTPQFHEFNFFSQPSPRPNFSSGAAGSSTTIDGTSTASEEIRVDVQGAPSTSRKRKKARDARFNAWFWKYFEQTFDENDNLIRIRCKVKKCKADFDYVSSNGTNTYSRHADKHVKKNEEPQERPDPLPVQTTINPDGTRNMVKYDANKMLGEFARYIAKKEYPIRMGGCWSFARLMVRGAGLPTYKPFHYRKMTKELKRQFIEFKNELQAIFATAPFKVAITSDIWTAGKHGLAYSCITAHFIDEFWRLQKRVISFRTIESPHTAEIICNSIMSVLREYNLKTDTEGKVSSISFDNASNNNKAVEYLVRALNPVMNGALFHQKCACHILNLTVKAGLKTEGVENLVKKFKNSLTFIYSNGVRKQNWHALCQRLGLSKLSVPWDVDTRWNSTYRMLERCLKYRDAIDEFLASSPEGLTMMLSLDEWTQLGGLMSFLRVFFIATVKLSCSYTPTAHELLHHLFYISKVYDEMKGTYLFQFFQFELYLILLTSY